MGLRNAIANLNNAGQASKALKQIEREYLTKYVAEQDARIAERSWGRIARSNGWIK